MARLVLSLDGQVMAEYNMNKERYTIGRLPDNDALMLMHTMCRPAPHLRNATERS